jgi:hypothetical protein
LIGALRGSGLKLTWTDPKITLHEAWLARGDRRTGEVIYRAWQLGSKFDAWQEGFRYEMWLQAFAECGLDPAFYTHRERPLDEIMPWQHISSGVRLEFLKEDYQWSLDGKTRQDCRDHCFACGILPRFNDLRAAQAEDAWKCPPVKGRKIRQKGREISAYILPAEVEAPALTIQSNDQGGAL